MNKIENKYTLRQFLRLKILIQNIRLIQRIADQTPLRKFLLFFNRVNNGQLEKIGRY